MVRRLLRPPPLLSRRPLLGPCTLHAKVLYRSQEQLRQGPHRTRDFLQVRFSRNLFRKEVQQFRIQDEFSVPHFIGQDRPHPREEESFHRIQRLAQLVRSIKGIRLLISRKVFCLNCFQEFILRIPLKQGLVFQDNSFNIVPHPFILIFVVQVIVVRQQVVFLLQRKLFLQQVLVQQVQRRLFRRQLFLRQVLVFQQLRRIQQVFRRLLGRAFLGRLLGRTLLQQPFLRRTFQFSQRWRPQVRSF